MYIAIYVSVIVLFCAIGLTIYGVLDKKNKERQRILQEKVKDENPTVYQESLFTKVELEPKQKEEEAPLVQPEEQINDFSFGNSDEQSVEPDESEDEFDGDEIDKRFKEYEEFIRKNVYSKHENKVSNSDFGSDEENLNANVNEAKQDLFSDDDFDDDYDSFNDFDDDFSENPNGDALTNKSVKNGKDDDFSFPPDFDYNSLIGKSEQEIENILQKLPPKVQQIMLSDILARRKFDDDEN